MLFVQLVNPTMTSNVLSVAVIELIFVLCSLVDMDRTAQGGENNITCMCVTPGTLPFICVTPSTLLFMCFLWVVFSTCSALHFSRPRNEVGGGGGMAPPAAGGIPGPSGAKPGAPPGGGGEVFASPRAAVLGCLVVFVA